ncbi:MAG: porin [Gammaproteobacteria bacterium]|nr:MAG: porin [Gammaproteobacteria bacterium]
MKNAQITRQLFFFFRLFRPLVAGVLLAVVALPVGAVDLKTSDGNWTFSISGNVNVHYIYSECEDSTTPTVAGGLACQGTLSGSNVSNISNGLLPAAFSFGVTTTQNGIDIGAHLGLYPGIVANDGGSPNLQQTATAVGTNTALATTGLDVRQVYLTFGNKEMGTFTLGRNIGLFGADVILNDMTLPGVGVAGGSSGAAPANTTLGSIGLGYIYTDWLAQIDYTTPEISGFSFTVGIFDPINSIGDAGTTVGKKAPGIHGKLSDTVDLGGGSKLYFSVAALEQKQDHVVGATTFDYDGTGIDVFVKWTWTALEAFGYYYHGDGLGTTGLFVNSSDGVGNKRSSSGYMAQATYKFGDLKLGANYGVSKLDCAGGTDGGCNGTLLVEKNRKVTVGGYYSLTKNLTLLAEVSDVHADAQSGASNHSKNGNVGAFFSF